MLLIDLTWTIQADRERALRDALRRHEVRVASAEASTSEAPTTTRRRGSSRRVVGVSIGDGASQLGDASAEVGRLQDFNPAAGT
jgi:CRP-like cAMP-binding protein